MPGVSTMWPGSGASSTAWNDASSSWPGTQDFLQTAYRCRMDSLIVPNLLPPACGLQTPGPVFGLHLSRIVAFPAFVLGGIFIIGTLLCEFISNPARRSRRRHGIFVTPEGKKNRGR